MSSLQCHHGQGRHRQISPRKAFLLRAHENFPSIEEAFAVNMNTDASSPASTNSLNLSIGARAALQDHLRHVAQYGLDSSQEVTVAKELLPDTYNLQDQQWERILEGTMSNASFLNETYSSVAHADLVLLNSTEQGDDSIVNKSYDYFNSSRVRLLLTPERNKKFQQPTIKARDESSSSSEEDSFADLDESFGDTSHVSVQRQQEEKESSFASMSSPAEAFHSNSTLEGSELSRIEKSFTDYDAQSTFSTELALSRSGRSGYNFTPPRQTRQFQSSPHFSPSPLKQSTPSCTKENDERDMQFNSLTLSPISSRRSNAELNSQNHFGQLLMKERVGNGLLEADSPTRLFNSGLNYRDNEDSTPRKRSSSAKHRISSSRMSFVSDPKRWPVTVQGSDAYEHASSTKHISSSASQSASVSASRISLAANDRRWFRTVVPHRVFMDQTMSDFTEALDSFSAKGDAMTR
jgi:hypothetical protein